MTTHSIADPPASLKIYGLVFAFGWFVFDQVTKWWILEGVVSPHGAIHVTPFFNLVLGWNRGISFGMLGGHDLPPWILALFSGSIAAGLIIWLLRTRDRLVAMGLALIIGGALGNALDRLRHGAVADFLDFHLADWHWPAFNFADVGIVCGAGLLILDTFIRGHSGAASEVSDRQP